MSIPPTKKRKLDGSLSGPKLTKSIPLKSSLKTAPNSQTLIKRPSSHSSLDSDSDSPSLSSNDAKDSFSDLDSNDGDISDTNRSASSSSDEWDLDSADEADMPSSTASKKRKRNDPTAFATSMSKILSSRLTTTARKDPVLIRSKRSAHQIDDGKLEAKAKRLLSQQKKEALEKGRIKDVVPKDDVSGEEVKRAMEREKALRKIAQRGVIKLFNAVRAAQVKGEEAARESKTKGTIGIDSRKQAVTEVSKENFLDMISKGKDRL
ncbi:hypothetical protein ABW19_dt0203644 [Dactylella cylindrospora]|nr:hypothetical protein ABW19_dt0203644 [Dactylella cylindrospora]